MADATMKYMDHHSSSATVNGGPDQHHSAFRLHKISISENSDEEEDKNPASAELRQPPQFQVRVSSTSHSDVVS